MLEKATVTFISPKHSAPIGAAKAIPSSIVIPERIVSQTAIAVAER